MSFYTTGSASVESGSTTVTGSGTAWALAAVTGGTFRLAGLSVSIASVTDDSTLELIYGWPGEDASSSTYEIVRENSEAANVVGLADKVSRLLVTLTLSGIQPKWSGTLEERDALTLDTSDEGQYFAYSVPTEDIVLYRWSGTAWEGPFLWRGEDGAQGPAGVGEGGYGVPSGGTTGQVLAKASGTDGDAEWSDPSGGMDAATYDPTGIEADAFDRANHTGPTPAGDATTPGLPIGDSDTGLSQTSGALHEIIDGVEVVRITPTGIAIGAGFDPASPLHIQAPGGVGQIRVEGEASTNMQAYLFNSSSPGPAWTSQHGRGTIAAPSPILQNDILGRFNFVGISNSSGGSKVGGRMDYKVLAATPSDTDMESQWTVFLCPPGSVTAGEALRFEHATGLSMFGANPVIDQNRHFRLRSYTVATKPATATAGAMIYVSDESGGAVVAFGDGTNWRRVTDRAVVS